ncbi:hypothetical protein AWB71_05259 [Caballeronia peredens]|nr:hypothetical protein AWB71_05259 [Caballeronia peredens]
MKTIKTNPAKTVKASSLLASLFKRADVPTVKVPAVTPAMQKEYDEGVARANKVRATYGNIISDEYLTIDDYNLIVRLNNEDLLLAA